MIFFLTTPVGAGHIRGFVERFDRNYGRSLVEMTYDEFARRGCASAGAYVFTDRIRMSEWFRCLAADLWDQISELGDEVRLFNHPLKQMGRRELLRALHSQGLGDFNVHTLAEFEASDVRFPVFLRLENDHSGPKSGLIDDEEGLMREVARMLLAGAEPGNLLITEFLDTRCEDGLYRKYGAWRFGDRIVGQHCLISEEWNVKAVNRLRTDEAIEETDAYFLQNPHAGALMPLFEVAGIEYGRVDYSILGGKFQVWEINDNPQYFGRNPMRRNRFGKGEVYFEAYRGLDEGIDGQRTIDLDVTRALRMEPVARR